MPTSCLRSRDERVDCAHPQSVRLRDRGRGLLIECGRHRPRHLGPPRIAANNRVTCAAGEGSSLAPIDVKLEEELVFGTDWTGTDEGDASGVGVRPPNELCTMSA